MIFIHSHLNIFLQNFESILCIPLLCSFGDCGGGCASAQLPLQTHDRRLIICYNPHYNITIGHYDLFGQLLIYISVPHTQLLWSPFQRPHPFLSVVLLIHSSQLK